MAKTKVPKRIGGVKLPKKVRKQAKKALKLVEAPVREFAVSGLTAAAEALAQRTATELRAAGETQRKTSLAALDLGDMLREAAIQGAKRFLEGFEEAQRATAAKPARAAVRKPTPPRKSGDAAKPKPKSKPAAKPKAAAKSPAKPKPATRARKPTGQAGRGGAAPSAGA